MDQELKQRLIGAVVITALAAIFIPMLFDDPVDNSGQAVSELTIPDKPVTAIEDAANKLPSNSAEVTGTPENGQIASDTEESDINPEEIAGSDREEEVLNQDNEQLLDEKKWIEESSGEDEPLDETENDQAGIIKTDPNETAKNQTSDDTISANDTTAPTKLNKPSATSPQTASENPADVADAGPGQTNSGLVRYYIQAGFFGKKENAMSLRENLRKQGFPAFLETVSTAKGSFYRLKVGPELDKKRAAELQARLNKQNIKTFIVSE